MTSIRRQLAAGATRLLVPRRRQPPVGAPPGTLVMAPDQVPPEIHLICYGPDRLDERPVTDLDSLRTLPPDGVTWVDVQGLGDEAVLRTLGEIFHLHPLALEDAVNVPQRPKAELYPDFYLFITRMTRLTEAHEVIAEQVTIFFGRNYVLTLQELRGDVLDPVRRRIRGAQGLIRQSGPDYLAYALIDTVIDGYYPVAESLGDRLQELEEEILACATPEGLRRIHRMRRELLRLRRAVWPQREAVNSLIRDESDLVSATVRQYLRDCYDHTVQLADVIETYRELATGLMDIYLSSMSQRTNEVMKVLTIVGAIFIPLTFLAGVYGMNFQYMPELHRRYGYPLLLLVMLVVAAGMVMFFKRKGWLGTPPVVPPGEERADPRS